MSELIWDSIFEKTCCIYNIFAKFVCVKIKVILNLILQLQKLPVMSKVINSLTANGINYTIYSGIEIEPTEER